MILTPFYISLSSSLFGYAKFLQNFLRCHQYKLIINHDIQKLFIASFKVNSTVHSNKKKRHRGVGTSWWDGGPWRESRSHSHQGVSRRSYERI